MFMLEIKPFLSALHSPRRSSAKVPGRKRTYITPVDEKTIGRRLRELREQQDMTQARLAAAVGVDQTLLSHYERGEARIHGALVAGFAKALGTSTDEILGMKDVKPTRNGHIKDRRFARRLQLIDRLSRRQKDALLTTVDTFLKAAGLDLRQG